MGDELPRGVEHKRRFLCSRAAAELSAHLRRVNSFAVREIRMFRRLVPMPRETAWFAPPGMDYAYSGHLHLGGGVPRWLDAVRADVAGACGAAFASILATRYRDGADAVAWHSDQEPELGSMPTVAVLSLGATRDLCFREKGKSGARWKVALAEGDLLIMRPGVQERLQHAVPRRAQAGTRVSLSFRPFEAGR